jgi:hypothetical protein
VLGKEVLELEQCPLRSKTWTEAQPEPRGSGSMTKELNQIAQQADRCPVGP